MVVMGCSKTYSRRPANLWNLDYNCGGYALKTFDWVDFSSPSYFDNAAQQVDELCRVLPEWERCDDFSDPRHYDYVAFRCGRDEDWEDFHFLRLWRNGTWHGKAGGGDIHKVEDVFAPWKRSDGKIYNGEIYFLRKRKRGARKHPRK